MTDPVRDTIADVFGRARATASTTCAALAPPLGGVQHRVRLLRRRRRVGAALAAVAVAGGGALAVRPVAVTGGVTPAGDGTPPVMIAPVVATAWASPGAPSSRVVPTGTPTTAPSTAWLPPRATGRSTDGFLLPEDLPVDVPHGWSFLRSASASAFGREVLVPGCSGGDPLAFSSGVRTAVFTGTGAGRPGPVRIVESVVPLAASEAVTVQNRLTQLLPCRPVRDTSRAWSAYRRSLGYTGDPAVYVGTESAVLLAQQTAGEDLVATSAYALIDRTLIVVESTGEASRAAAATQIADLVDVLASAAERALGPVEGQAELGRLAATVAGTVVGAQHTGRSSPATAAVSSGP